MNSKPLHPSRHRFRASRLPQTIKTSPFRRNLKGLWAKKGKYEYCYHFSRRQNHPKRRPSIPYKVAHRDVV